MERSAWANYCLTTEDGTDRLSRNVGIPPTLCNIPEKRRPQLHHGGSLKPHIIRVKQHGPYRLSRTTALPGVVDVRGVRGVPGTSSSLSPTSSFHDTDRSWAGAAFLGDTTMARSAVPFMLATSHVWLQAKYWAQLSWTNLPLPLTALRHSWCNRYMAQPITVLPLFRLLFLLAICNLFYWIQADWTSASSRTIMRHESGSLRETPVTRGLHPTNRDSFHMRSGRWLTSNSAQCVAQTPLIPYSFRISTSERKQTRRVVG